MTQRTLDQIRGKPCFLVSADERGYPHLAAATVERAEEDLVTVTGWFCPQTLSNLESNSRVTVAITRSSEGVQLAGQVEERAVEAVMDGFYPTEREVPQAKFRLAVRVRKAMRLTDRPHSDEALEV